MDIDDILKREEFENLDKFLTYEMKKTAGDELYKKIIDTFNDEIKARAWFYTPSFALGNKRPYDYCLKDKKDYVKSELINIDHGILL